MSKKQIPNILSVIRLLMVPLFVWLVLSDFEYASVYAVVTFILAGLTDVLDGYLARRNNWITDLGKILDPLADKMMQCAAFICLAILNPFLIWIVVIVVVKELAFLAIGFFVRKKIDVVIVAKWYGKMATFVITVCVCVLIVWWSVPLVTYICAGASAFVMLFASVMYAIYYSKLIKQALKG